MYNHRNKKQFFFILNLFNLEYFLIQKNLKSERNNPKHFTATVKGQCLEYLGNITLNGYRVRAGA